MDYDYSKRGYLLPEGCKDLIDVVKSHAQQEHKQPMQTPLVPFPPTVGELAVGEHMTVLELATALKRKPLQIIADLMELNVFANLHQQVDFGTIAKLVRKYGCTAKRTD